MTRVSSTATASPCGRVSPGAARPDGSGGDISGHRTRLAYTIDSVWRNRDLFIAGRAEIVATCHYRAAEWRHKEIELAAHELLQYLDATSARGR
jgi:hypothetical protein